MRQTDDQNRISTSAIALMIPCLVHYLNSWSMHRGKNIKRRSALASGSSRIAVIVMFDLGFNEIERPVQVRNVNANPVKRAGTCPLRRKPKITMAAFLC